MDASELIPGPSSPVEATAGGEPGRELGALTPRDRRLLAGAAVLVLGLALYIYQPWRDVGFDIEDFSEFELLLERSPTFGARGRALLDYYATQGRWNFVVYYGLAAKWSLFGPDPKAWQYLRFGQMLGVACMVFWLVRSFRLGIFPAGAAALLFVFSSAAAASFGRLTMSEPVALTVLLPALLVAVRYQRIPHWKSSAALITVLAALVVGSKEVLIVCLPFVVLCAILWSPEGWRPPGRSWRNRVLVGGVGLVMLAFGVSVLLVARQGGAESYASQYGRTGGYLDSFPAVLGWMVLPVQRPVGSINNPPAYPANALILLLLLAGIALWWWRSVPKPTIALSLFASLPVLGATVYAPWPRFEEFYALPFLLGVALMLAFALEATVHGSKANGWVAAGLFAAALGFMVVNAKFATERRFANRAVHRGMVEVIRSVRDVDSVLVVTQWGGRSWPALAPTLARVARRPVAAGYPPVLGSKCEEVPPPASLPSTIIVMQYVKECGAIQSHERAIVSRYRYWNWRTLSSRIDSIRVDVGRGAKRSGVSVNPF